ncbi:uncharacterized protein METZ01_LOCUS463722, partial [marine metagenome]
MMKLKALLLPMLLLVLGCSKSGVESAPEQSICDG